MGRRKGQQMRATSVLGAMIVGGVYAERSWNLLFRSRLFGLWMSRKVSLLPICIFAYFNIALLSFLDIINSWHKPTAR